MSPAALSLHTYQAHTVYRETTDAVIRHVYGRVSTPGTIGLLSHLFHVDDLMDEQQFNIIHKIILGLADSRDLSEECREHPELVDESDLRGRTPLWWAALRHDLDSCGVLLGFGSDPNTFDYQGETIMQNAAASTQADLVQLLLDHGANVSQGAGVAETPLHYAARSNARTQTLQVLLDHGADPNAANINGFTPLHESIEVDAIDIAKMLCKYGAELDHRDASGDTYLHMAIRCRSAKILRMLIAKECDVAQLGGEKQSILHTAARFADAKIIKVLMDTDLASIDVSLMDSRGRTAASYVEERINDARRTNTEDELMLEGLLEGDAAVHAEADEGFGKDD